MDKHYKELDSLRGLAALTVMVQHICLVLPVFTIPYEACNNTFVWLLRFTPLGFVNAGREAVIFFFVLSGFVLTLPFLRANKAPTYPAYVIKRICRIYPPYLAAVIFAVAMNALFYRGPVPGLSGWFSLAWRPQIDWPLVLQHLFLINSFDHDRFNPVLWSLVIEMRISLLFPLFVYCVVKYDWKLNLLGGALLHVIGWGSFTLHHNHVINLTHDYSSTFCFMLMFIVGSLLAKNRHSLVDRFTALSRVGRYAGLCLAFLAYTNAFWLEHLFHSKIVIQALHTQITKDTIVTVAVSAFIIMALASRKISSVLLFKPLHFLGKISYSFYLLHAVCLLALVHLLYGKVPYGVIILLTVAVSFGIATLGYYGLEMPSIRLGKYLTSLDCIRGRNQSANPEIPTEDKIGKVS